MDKNSTLSTSNVISIVEEERQMTPSNQNQWLIEHIPHRLRACLTGLPLQEELMPVSRSREMVLKIQQRCAGNAIWEGRMAGMRWLIELLGVVDYNGKPRRPNRREVDVSIEMIPGGKEIDLSSSEASVLSRVWKGCSQASGHPTQDSNHPPVDAIALDRAMRIIVAHLDRTVYAAHVRPLVDQTLVP